MSELKTWHRDSFMQMKREGRRGDASFSIHEVSWPCLSCQSSVRVCVCLRATSKPPEAPHTHTSKYVVHAGCLAGWRE